MTFMMHPSSGRAPPAPFSWSALAAAPPPPPPGMTPFGAAAAVTAGGGGTCRHALVYGVTAGHPAYARGWTCNGCSASGDASATRRWVCAVCVYDLCETCGARCSGCGAPFGGAAYYGCSVCSTVNYCGTCERAGACEAHAPAHVFVRTRQGINATLHTLRASVR